MSGTVVAVKASGTAVAVNTPGIVIVMALRCGETTRHCRVAPQSRGCERIGYVLQLGIGG